MSTIRIEPREHKEAEESTGKGFRVLEPGPYAMEIVGVEYCLKFGKTIDTNKPFICFHLDSGENVILQDLVWLTPNALWRLVQYERAANVKVSDPETIHLGAFMNRVVKMHVSVKSQPRRDGNGTFKTNEVGDVEAPPGIDQAERDASAGEFKNVDCQPAGMDDLPF
jgi:hypothetical protein